jgi:hypothetical protein
MVKQKSLRIPDDLDKINEDDRKQKNISSENDYYLQALEHFHKCKKLEESASMKPIILRYSGTCLKCKQPVDAGQWALYGRGVGVVCMDCYIERIGDKPLIAKFLKMRELDQTVKALRHEALKLADKVEVLQFASKLDAVFKKDEEMRNLVFSYLRQGAAAENERVNLEDIVRAQQELQALLNDLKSFFEKRIKTKNIIPIES